MPAGQDRTRKDAHEAPSVEGSREKSGAWILPALGLAVVFAIAIAVGVGATPIDWSALMKDGPAGGQPYDIVVGLRLPRALAAGLVGASLGCGGAVSQSLFRNPLADPTLLGIASGASLGTALFLALSGAQSALPMPVVAFVSALATTGFVLRLGRRSKGPDHLLLAGLAVNALAGAGVGIVSYLASHRALRAFTFWTLGGLSHVHWTHVMLLAPLTAIALGLAFWKNRELDLLALGEVEAEMAGASVGALKRVLVISLAMGVGAAVSTAGLIGFVGLVAPHIIRRIVGPLHRSLLVGSALVGALLLILADLLARTASPPEEIPVGLFTALLGAPLFLHLISKRASPW